MHRALTTSLYRGLITLSMGMLLPGLGAAAVSATEGDDVPDGQETQPTPSLSALQTRDSTVPLGLMYYVTTNGSDSADGQSWETAKLTIQAALSDAASGDTVLVSNGTYAVDGQIAVTNGITLRSVNGADETIIERTGGTERLILIKHADAVVDGFTITKSTYGGVYIDQAGTLLNSIVSDNDSTLNTLTYGGGIYLNQGGLVKNCQIINNTLNRSGGYNHYAGGVYMTGGGMLDACIISNNVSRYGTGTGGQGGGVYMTGSATRMRNCLITRNSHNMNTSGVYCNLGVIENCTIVDNYCDPITAAAGLYSSNGKVINTIIAYNNNASGLSNYRNAGTTWTYQNSCTDPLVAGDGNTDRAPQFIDLEARDYRLLAGPCVNTGINQAWMESSLDLDGNPRIVSETVDMGAYEHIPGSLRIGYEGIPTEGFSSNLVVFTAYASGTNTTGLYYRWSFKNDETIDNEGFGHSVVTNLYGPGIHSVSLTVSNAIDEADTLVREQYIKVAPEIAYVSTNGASIYPYDTWATAATNIHDAVAASSDGTLILVSNGVYQISRQIELIQNIAVRSVSGAEHTTIRRESGTASIFYTTRSEAVIDGFTLANANQSAVYLDGAGVVSNCIIRDTYTINNTAYGGGVRLEGGGHVSNCHIINNYVQSSGGAGRHGGGIYLNGGGLVEFCVISNNAVGVGTGSSYRGGGVYMSGGILRNSLIYDNRHNVAAGGVYCSGGVVENCTIVSNACTKATDAVAGLQSVNGTIRNTIVQDNTAATGLYNYLNSGSTTYNNCNTYPTNGLTGSANIDDDPLFKNVAIGDCRLANGSPCINAGTNQVWMAGAVDLAGQPRILNKLVDIGAYEGRLPGGTLLILQ